MEFKTTLSSTNRKRLYTGLFLSPFIFLILTLTACVSTKYIQQDSISKNHEGKAYIIVKGKIGEGNIERIAFNLFVNGSTVNAYTKAIELESSQLSPPWPKFCGDIKKMKNDVRSAYHVWELPKKYLKKKAVCLMYIRNIENKFSRVYGYAVASAFPGGYWNSPVECMFLTNPRFTGSAAFDSGKFKDLQEKREPDATFYGIGFTIDKPGVYYLGDVEIAGELYGKKESAGIVTELKKYASITTDNIPQVKEYLKQIGLNEVLLFFLAGENKNSPNLAMLMNYSPETVENITQVKKYINEIGLNGLNIYSLHKYWNNIYMGDFRTYFKNREQLNFTKVTQKDITDI